MWTHAGLRGLLAVKTEAGNTSRMGTGTEWEGGVLVRSPLGRT